MRRRPWGAHLAAIGALCLLATVSFATPHDDSAHRSGLPVTLTLVDGRQRQREECPGGLGPHRGNIGKVDGERAVTDETRIESGREMRALDDRVHREDERDSRRCGDERTIVADACEHIVPRRAAPRKIALDDLEFARGHASGDLAALGAAMRA